MSVSAQTLRLLMEAGLAGEQLIAVVESIEADGPGQEAAKSKGALRTQRWRERKASHGDVTVTSQEASPRDVTSVTDSDPSRARVVIPSAKEEKKEGSLSLPSEARPLDDADAALEAYNAAAKLAGWVSAAKLTAPRRASIKARLAEAGGLHGWRDAMQRARGSPFLSGDNDRGWRPNLDFFLQAKSFTKLIEGAYDDRKPRTGPTSQPASRARSGADAYLAAIHQEVERLDDRGFPDRRDPGADFGDGPTLDLEANRAA